MQVSLLRLPITFRENLQLLTLLQPSLLHQFSANHQLTIILFKFLLLLKWSNIILLEMLNYIWLYTAPQTLTSKCHKLQIDVFSPLPGDLLAALTPDFLWTFHVLSIFLSNNSQSLSRLLSTGLKCQPTHGGIWETYSLDSACQISGLVSCSDVATLCGNMPGTRYKVVLIGIDASSNGSRGQWCWHYVQKFDKVNECCFKNQIWQQRSGTGRRGQSCFDEHGIQRKMSFMWKVEKNKP